MAFGALCLVVYTSGCLVDTSEAADVLLIVVMVMSRMMKMMMILYKYSIVAAERPFTITVSAYYMSIDLIDLMRAIVYPQNASN